MVQFSAVEFDVINNNRVAGTFLSANFYGIYLVCCLLILWSLSILTSYKKAFKIIYLFTIIGLIIGLYLSKSRGAFLALLISGAFFSFKNELGIIKILKKRFKKKWIYTSMVGLVIIGLTGGLYFYNKDSVSGRQLIVKIGSKTILEKPIFGHGLNNFTKTYNKAKSDYFWEEFRGYEEIKVANYVTTAFNEFLEIFIEFGLVGFLLSLTLVIILLSEKSVDSNVILGQSIILAIVIFSFTNAASKSIPLMIMGAWATSLILNKSSSKRYILKFTYLQKVIMCALFVFSFLFISLEIIRKKNGIEFLSLTKNATSRQIKSYETNVIKQWGIFDNGHAVSRFGQKLSEFGAKKSGLFYQEEGFRKTLYPKDGKYLAQSLFKNSNYDRTYELLKFNMGNEPYRFSPKMEMMHFLKHTGRLRELSFLCEQIIATGVKIPSDSITNYKKQAADFLEFFNPEYHNNYDLAGTLSLDREFFSDALEMMTSYRVYLPPIKLINKKLPVLYVLDGDQYSKNTNLIAQVDKMIVREEINPVIVILLNSDFSNFNNDDLRANLFNCNPKYYHFFVDELLPYLESKYPITIDPKSRNILGVSFGGLAASYLELNSKKPLFNSMVLQSPAFYRCPNIYDSFRSENKKSFKIYMSYGTGDDTEEQVLPLIDIWNRNTQLPVSYTHLTLPTTPYV